VKSVAQLSIGVVMRVVRCIAVACFSQQSLLLSLGASLTSHGSYAFRLAASQR